MVAPVVRNQFEVGKNKIVHKPTKAAFSFDTGHTTFKSVNWGRAGGALQFRIPVVQNNKLGIDATLIVTAKPWNK
jgi:hypothetical protein